MRPMVCFLAAFAVCDGPSAAFSAPVPDRKAGAWVFVATERGNWVVRVDGGMAEQTPAARPKRKGDGEWVHLQGAGPGRSGLLVEDGKRVLYHEEDPAAKGKAGKFGDRPHRLMLADRDGNNPKQLLTGLKWNQGFHVAPDGKSVLCGAAEAGKWSVFRAPLDGSPPVKVSQVAGLDHPPFRVLPDGRVLYLPVTGWHQEKVQFGTWTIGKGPVILTDGKKETVLVKESLGVLPEITDDATRMAVARRNEAGEAVVEVIDLKTGKSETTPVKAFNAGWSCRFGATKFSPDGKALAVTFFLGNVVIREKGPLPGDEAVQHFGVIWLDGRRDRTALFKVDQPPKENGYFSEIRHLEWAAGPEVKK